MSAARGVGGREVPGAVPVNGTTPQQGGGKKKKKKSGKRGGKGKNTANAPPPVEQREESTSGADAESESSLYGNGVDVNLDRVNAGSDSSLYESGVADKITDDSSIEEDKDDTIVARDLQQAVDEHVPTDREALMDAMPISAKQLLDEPGKAEEPEEPNPVALWLESKMEHPYKAFTETLRQKIIEHMTDSLTADYDPTFMRYVRETIWRAVVRANYWWVNPDTGMPTGRQKPIAVNEGVYSGNFEAWVECCAMRQDRVGRDIATHEFVHKVEDDVRAFLFRAEKGELYTQLEHLAFLLLFDETKKHPSVLEMHDMQERIAVAFGDAGARMNWKGLHFMRSSGKKPVLNNNQHPGIAEIVWKDAFAEL